MLHLFLPNKYVDSIFHLCPQKLKKEGIKGIVVDLDNTLVPWNVPYATKEIKEWFQQMLEQNFEIMIFSNNDEDRVKAFAEPLKIPYIYRAKKPLKQSFKKATKKMNISKGQLAVIGDQLLTDILGGNRFGAYTILVSPLVGSDAPITKFNRRIEKHLLNYFYNRDQLPRRINHGD